mgnify:CR=1 FL=1
MDAAFGPVGREVGFLCRELWVEDQEHPPPGAEEGVPGRFELKAGKAQDPFVEGPGLLQVLGVDGSLQNLHYLSRAMRSATGMASRVIVFTLPREARWSMARATVAASSASTTFTKS